MANQALMNDVALFVEVINAGSFIAAGKKMGISKPSVSRRINDLEKALNTKLIKRTTRKLSLTESGQILYERCKDFDGTLNGAISAITNLRERPTGKLKIGFSSYFANDYNAIKIISDFMKTHPGIHVELHSFTTSTDIDLINKDFDLYFTDNDMSDSHLTSALIVEYPIVVCATPAYFQKNGLPKKPEELLHHNCLLHYLYEKPVNEWGFNIHDKNTVVKVSGSLYASRTHLLLKMARTGTGIAQLPLFMVEKYLKTGELIAILDDYPIKSSSVYATIYRQKTVPKKLQFFMDYIKNNMAGKKR